MKYTNPETSFIADILCDFDDKILFSNSSEPVEITFDHCLKIAEEISNDIQDKTLEGIKSYINEYLKKNEYFIID